MSRNSLADKSTGNITTQGTHNHSGNHSNKISGVLAGTWGVEPIYDGIAFGPDSVPSNFTVKSGVGDNKVEFEYQICLKCHSNYAYEDNGNPDNAMGSTTHPNDRPETGGAGTPYLSVSTSLMGRASTNSFRNYTNQAMEFYAPTTHQGQPSKGHEAGACSTCGQTPRNSDEKNYPYSDADLDTNNHRAWHPVMGKTGRTSTIRGSSDTSWLPPFNAGVGDQTMYCTDCHGASNGDAENSEPTVGTPWGPHGSNRNFLLRGTWERGSARKLDDGNLLCLKCHNKAVYPGSSSGTAFQHGGTHTDKVGILDCMWCHVAIPHGWKNRGFLVNLNDIGPEVMCRAVDNSTSGYNVKTPLGVNCKVGEPIPKGSVVTTLFRSGGIGYNNPPYYINARLRIRRFPTSNWSASDCGSNGKKDMIDLLCNSPGY